MRNGARDDKKVDLKWEGMKKSRKAEKSCGRKGEGLRTLATAEII